MVLRKSSQCVRVPIALLLLIAGTGDDRLFLRDAVTVPDDNDDDEPADELEDEDVCRFSTIWRFMKERGVVRRHVRPLVRCCIGSKTPWPPKATTDASSSTKSQSPGTGLLLFEDCGCCPTAAESTSSRFLSL